MIQLNLKNLSTETGQSLLEPLVMPIPKGEFVLLTGQSGSGKTSLLNCLNGLVHYDDSLIFEGELKINQQVMDETTQDAWVSEVGSVFQNPRTQFFTSVVRDELVFVCENLQLPKEEITASLGEVSQLFGIESLLDKEMATLSSGQQQLVALAAAYMQRPQVLLLDEPTSNLDEKATKRISQVLGELKEQGMTIVVADHRFMYLSELVDRVIVLDDGQVKMDESYQVFSARSLAERRELGMRVLHADELAKEHVQVSGSAEDYLVGKELQVTYPGPVTALSLAEFHLSAGQITCLVGDNGAGKSTLLKTVAGLERGAKGTFYQKDKVASRRQRRGETYLVLQEAHLQLLGETTEKELALSPASKEERVQVAIDFSLDHVLTQHPLTLSGGQQQRLAIASSYLADKELVILDEPTSGLDYRHMMSVVKSLQTLAQQGKTLLVVSHDWEFIQALGAAVVRLENGKIV
ncbi:ABC transporter ATP-binding protein [Vagococcus coleopterorum]|uniref:ABC transporter ATP-binding protein n=1 Tax=Vagococcus coleopterorum TaxID=2714946 RepID=A0A6G8AKS5_9ENTE|nr:ABC transporter ATP-binding protein [Vagococcus coleopterorum]QIL45671.1 ABC transporter ATP-binding protein [Vagococcus coleopterorum]